MTKLFSSASFSQPKNVYLKLNNLFWKRAQGLRPPAILQFSTKGRDMGRCWDFTVLHESSLCVDCLGWNTTNPYRCSMGKHLGRCCKTPGSSTVAGKCHHQCPSSQEHRAGRAGTWPCPHFWSSQQSWTEVEHTTSLRELKQQEFL